MQMKGEEKKQINMRVITEFSNMDSWDAHTHLNIENGKVNSFCAMFHDFELFL